MLLKWFVLVILASMSSAYNDYPCNPDDHYVQNLGASETGLIYVNPQEGTYTGEKRCYWLVTCPAGAEVNIHCPTVLIPESHLCTRDRLLIKKHANIIPQRFCGNQSGITTVAFGNVMGVSLQAPADTEGGYFECQTSCNFVIL